MNKWKVCLTGMLTKKKFRVSVWWSLITISKWIKTFLLFNICKQSFKINVHIWKYFTNISYIYFKKGHITLQIIVWPICESAVNHQLLSHLAGLRPIRWGRPIPWRATYPVGQPIRKYIQYIYFLKFFCVDWSCVYLFDSSLNPPTHLYVHLYYLPAY